MPVVDAQEIDKKLWLTAQRLSLRYKTFYSLCGTTGGVS